MTSKPIGIILLAFGGADSPEAIEPFMKNLMGGRVPPPPLVEKIKARYTLIGGKSPLPEITAKQAQKLEELLNSEGGNFKTDVGMRYWNPFISEGLERLLNQGVTTVVAVSLAPFYSEVSTGSYQAELERAAAAVEGKNVNIVMAGSLYNNPLYIAALAEKVKEGLAEFEDPTETPVIFSAHSIPVSYIEKGDPYAEQFRFAVDRVVESLNLKNWYAAYQSKGGGEGQWLEPTVETVMDELKAKGHTGVLVASIGFVSDHIETLYDVDIAQKSHAAEIGLQFQRAGSLNTSDLFIKALAAVVKEKL
ncbi:MAG TPA: ferrochelatase [Desulfobacteria bacterium]|nr:ferrochelatase [Desulfobacteria bacterium]